MTTATANTTGKIVQVIGPGIDVEFEAEQLPELYNALEVKGTTDAGQAVRVVAEVQQHIGRNQVRAVAMSSTDGITRGMDAVDTGSAITVPVGEAALGRILNVLVELQSPGTYQAAKRLVHTVQQDNIQHLLIGEMHLKASASRFAYAVVGDNVIDRLQQGRIRIIPFAHA